jgi:hypothetical protein
VRFVFEKKKNREKEQLPPRKGGNLISKRAAKSARFRPLTQTAGSQSTWGLASRIRLEYTPSPRPHAIHAGGKGERPSPGPVPGKAGRYLPGQPAAGERAATFARFCRAQRRSSPGASRISEKLESWRREVAEQRGLHAADSAAPNGSTTLVLFKLSRSSIQKAKVAHAAFVLLIFKHCTLLCFMVVEKKHI